MKNHPFTYCARCGHGGLVTVTHMELQCRACGFKHFINPVPAAVAILSDPGGRVLLIERGRDPGKGLLALPGGFVEPGESAEEALRREIREEVAVEVETLTFLVSLPNLYRYQGWDGPVLDLFYTGMVRDFDGVRPQPGEIAGVQVVAKEAVPYERIAFLSNAEALRRYARAQAGSP